MIGNILYTSTFKRVCICIVTNVTCSNGSDTTPGGGFSLTNGMYTGMLKDFEVHFRKFWYIDGCGYRHIPNAPILQNWVYFGKFSEKSTQFASNWVLFAEKWYRDGSQNHAFRGIEMVEILNSTLSIPVQIFLRNPPPPGYNISCIHKHTSFWAIFIVSEID